jgi:hypothetical protein
LTPPFVRPRRYTWWAVAFWLSVGATAVSFLLACMGILVLVGLKASEGSQSPAGRDTEIAAGFKSHEDEAAVPANMA